MQFASPELLYALWGVIPLVLFLSWAQRRRRERLHRFVAPSLSDEIVKDFSRGRSRWKNFLIVLMYIFSFVALSRPQWGFEWQNIRRQGLDIIFTIDTSKSMLAEDVKPNRLERTKLAIKDFLKRLTGDRVGIVAFAGEGFLICPLTSDYNGFQLSLDDLSVNTIPRGGTNLGTAISEAARQYDQTPSKYKVVVIFTDGENLEGDPLALAKKAKEKGIKVYCVGIGTPEGELVRVPDGQGGTPFLKDEKGNFVKSQLNESLLQQIALTTGGAYIRASGADFGLDVLYDRELSRFEKREFAQKMEKKYFERFQVPLALAVIFLILETGLTTKKRES